MDPCFGAKTWSFPIKTGVKWVLGIYIYIQLYSVIRLYIYIIHTILHFYTPLETFASIPHLLYIDLCHVLPSEWPELFVRRDLCSFRFAEPTGPLFRAEQLALLSTPRRSGEDLLANMYGFPEIQLYTFARQ